MAYQFLHIETYSRKARPVESGGYTLGHHMNSTAQVFGEAMREALYSSHVDAPRPPREVGYKGLIRLAELKALHDQRANEILETLSSRSGASYQRKLREDADTLYTEIHSHPMTCEEYRADTSKNHPIIVKWLELVLADFSKRMPEGIKASAVVHFDESHVHMHILAINLDDPKLDANKLHIGKRKAAEVRETHDDRLPALPQPELLPKPLKPKAPKPSRTPKTQAKRQAEYQEALANWEKTKKDVAAANEATLEAWKEANREQRQRERRKVGKPKATQAYNAAMTQLQDDYHEAVGKPCGLLRDGPKAQRLSTVEYDRAKKQAQKSVEAKAALSKLEAAKWDAEVVLAATQAEQEAERARTAAAMQDLERLREAQKAKERVLADREAKLAVERERHRVTSQTMALQSFETTAKAAQLKEQEESLAQREAQLEARTSQLDEREETISQKAKEMQAETASQEAALRQREAALNEREAEAQQRASQLDQRQATFDANLAKATQSIASEKAKNQTQENQLIERETALATKEKAIEAAQQEIEEVTQGMEALMVAVENEEVDLVAEPQAPKRLHKAFLRLVMTQPDKQSPLQRLLGRFVSFLKRGQSVDGGPSYDRSGPRM